MSRIIAVANQKGGVGKTTTCASLAVALTELGESVLAIDLDPQSHLTMNMGIDPNNLENTIYHAILQKGVSIGDILVNVRQNLDLAPVNRDLAAAEILLLQEAGGEVALAKSLGKVIEDYGYILIDCPPNLGKLTINALTAAHEVIIPVECSYFAVKGLGQLLDTIDLVEERLNPDLHIVGILLTMYDGRTLHVQQITKRLQEAFGKEVFNTAIPRTIRFNEASARGETILEYAANHKGALAYRQLAKEVIHRG